MIYYSLAHLWVILINTIGKAVK